MAPKTDVIEQLRVQLAAAQDQVAAMEERLERQRSYFDAHQNILMDEIETAEQRVAEAIVDMLQQKHRNCFGAHSFYLAASVATANGEWRKFLKEMRDA